MILYGAKAARLQGTNYRYIYSKEGTVTRTCWYGTAHAIAEPGQPRCSEAQKIKFRIV